MITFKQYRENKDKELTNEDLSPFASQLIIEITEFLWKVTKLIFRIIAFLIRYSIKTVEGSGKFLYNRYNKEARADRRFERQLNRTSKEIKKIRLARDKYQNAIFRLESMKETLKSISKEDKAKHKRELMEYNKALDELTAQANAAYRKLQKVT